MGSGKVKTLILFCSFTLLLSALLFCGCAMFIVPPVEMHIEIKNNDAGTIAITNGDEKLIDIPIGQTEEMIYWRYAAIIISRGYSKEIDLFHNRPNDILKKSRYYFFPLRKVFTCSFEVTDKGIAYRAQTGKKFYKTYQSINYDEILFVREGAKENDFITLKIKNTSDAPIRLTSLSPLEPSDNHSFEILILKDIFQPTFLPPEAEYVMTIPAGKILSDIVNFQIETNCLQQPALQCKIVKYSPHSDVSL